MPYDIFQKFKSDSRIARCIPMDVYEELIFHKTSANKVSPDDFKTQAGPHPSKRVREINVKRKEKRIQRK